MTHPLVKYTVIYSRGECVNKCQSEPCLKYDREHNFDSDKSILSQATYKIDMPVKYCDML